MAESPQFYMPDVQAQWSPEGHSKWLTETVLMRGGRRQRRAVQNQKIRAWKLMNANVLSQEDRRALYDFFNTVAQGTLNSFYFFETSPRTLVNVPGSFACTAPAPTRSVILPVKGPSWMGYSPALAATYPANEAGVQGGLKRSDNTTLYGTGYTAPAGMFDPLIPRGNRYCGLYFDGVTAYVDCGSSSTLKINTAFTISAWVYLCNAAAYGNTVKCWPIVSNKVSTTSGFHFYVNASQSLQLDLANGGSTFSASGSVVIQPRTWTHVSVFFDHSGHVYFAVNGQFDGGSHAIGGTQTLPTQNMYIGRDSTIGYFHGMLQGVRIYNADNFSHSVAPTLLYQEVPSIDYDSAWGIVSHWKLTDGIGATTVADSFGSNTGTLSGTSLPQWVGGEDCCDFRSDQTGKSFSIPQVANARQRVCVTFGQDDIPESFLADVVPVSANFDIQLLEAV